MPRYKKERSPFSRSLTLTFIFLSGLLALELSKNKYRAPPKPIPTPTLVPNYTYLDPAIWGSVPASEAESDERLDRLTEEIKQYRRSFQLIPLPELMSEDNLNLDKNINWDSPPPTTNIHFPEYEKSFEKRIGEIYQITFGVNYPRVISEVTGYGVPGRTSARNDVPKIELTVDLHSSYDINGGFLDLLLHEGFHPVNPESFPGVYPLERKIRMEHGMWRAMTRAFAIQGEFFNHPADEMLPELKLKTGAAIAKTYVGDPTLGGQLDGAGMARLESLLQAEASIRNTSVDKLIFDIDLCKKIGGIFIDDIRAGRVIISGNLQSEYSKAFDDAAVEISAEMFRIAILHPELIGYDAEIMGGIEEVLSAFHGHPVSLAVLKSELAIIDKSLLDLNIAEAEQIATAGSADNLDAVKKHNQDITDQVYSLIGSGTLPSQTQVWNDEQINLVIAYSKSLNQLYLRYPKILERVNDFNPNLHYWQIQEINGAVNFDVLWNFLNDPNTLTPYYEDWLRNKTVILDNFIANNP